MLLYICVSETEVRCEQAKQGFIAAWDDPKRDTFDLGCRHSKYVQWDLELDWKF